MRISFSPVRQKILKYVQKASSPVSARSIHKKMGKGVAFSTVYRALWFLEENGHVEGFSLSCGPCGKDRFFIDASRGHVHYFHCDVCHSFTEIDGCVVKVKDIERKLGAVVKRHILLYSGLCRTCR
jgi:Fur family transcriptional regulator, ferric uptake regulator